MGAPANPASASALRGVRGSRCATAGRCARTTLRDPLAGHEVTLGASDDDGQAWERAVGAASLPLAPSYAPRSPEPTPLHRAVRAHLQSFLEEARARSAHGVELPGFVEREFREYLGCGVLAHGFARVRCESCGDEHLVGFSCKRRGLCPSCTTRRAVDAAAHLVDAVLPQVPMRQWVLSLPIKVRWVLARRPVRDPRVHREAHGRAHHPRAPRAARGAPAAREGPRATPGGGGFLTRRAVLEGSARRGVRSGCDGRDERIC